jgi:hypothetical protein
MMFSDPVVLFASTTSTAFQEPAEADPLEKEKGDLKTVEPLLLADLKIFSAKNKSYGSVVPPMAGYCRVNPIRVCPFALL